ncbi:MAG: hypothetical protein DRQ62_09920 [Gammaproteobacteria bacterium]|nr:MAG: hypothetical protein DRQ62_09920 [Gammaproteobacteria bacterium]
MVMEILNLVESIREKAKAYGNYQLVADNSGVGYQWLSKFATGAIQNPTINNVAKLEVFFQENNCAN